ncbi:immunity 52 family protein [Xenorhabdus bovienii]|uniref:Imm52 family immunity protein n=1 Tax=Xenorhabdus bovienii TaxID=40576 RepID=UPI00237CFF54|nr:Imm52 family immunity protein [Xenorhabdus bovienii]MDE1476300.1 immunity 52 family protein [Xenorhabdus bovienii]MDE9437067.1 immunity 52 family protein [Xenorhabdus bovienii]MDE9467125.1 immunity 52 family protein [Xenorhabdus bovienii]MDE9498710.1 immunity 52 family protein [Xenorhabdus bovienii]
MSIINLEFKIYYQQKNDNNIADIALMELHQITRRLDIFFGRKKVWYLKGNSKKQALQHIVFDENGPTEVAIKRFKKDYVKNNSRTLITGIWDGEEDDCSCSISYHFMNINRPDSTTLSLDLYIDVKELTISKLLDMTTYLITSRNSPIIQIETNSYTLKGNKVFPDRLGVGWVFYTPNVLDTNVLPEAEDIQIIYQENKAIGTLIFSKKGIFDGKNQEDIYKSNDIEIRLRDLGLLPLRTEL